jgi:hypothetical protein
MACNSASDRQAAFFNPMIANVIVLVLTLLIVVRFFTKYGH